MNCINNLFFLTHKFTNYFSPTLYRSNYYFFCQFWEQFFLRTKTYPPPPYCAAGDSGWPTPQHRLIGKTYMYTTVQGQTVSAYFTSKQTLSFGFAEDGDASMHVALESAWFSMKKKKKKKKLRRRRTTCTVHVFCSRSIFVSCSSSSSSLDISENIYKHY